jgi:hypothetical protein
MKKITAASLIIAILSIALSVMIYFQNKNPDKTIKVAGVIRSADENGWYVINNDGHKPLNIAKVEVKNGLIVVNYTFKASAIHTFMVTPDETFARAGYFVGASVGLSAATISVSQVVDGKVAAVDASTIRSKLGNFWIYGLFEIEEGSE